MRCVASCTIVLVFVLALAEVGQAQVIKVLPIDFERGDISEIKDKRRAYVSVVSVHERQNILKEIAKHKEDIQLARNPSEADFVVAFATEARQVGISSFGPIREKWNYYARLVVYIRREGKKPRVVWETTKLYADLVKREIPLTNMRLELVAARDFIKALKKARRAK